jgi:hypothetical protein
LACAAPLAGAAQTPPTTEMTDGACLDPKFDIEGWEDPGTLVINATADPAREFAIHVGINKQGTTTLKGDESHPCNDTMISEFRNAKRKDDFDPASSDFDYLACYPKLTLEKDKPRKIRIHFHRAAFQRLLGENGKIHIHFKSDVKGCPLNNWTELTVYDRSLFRLEAGADYDLNSTANWKSNSEAAARYSTRWSTDLSGAAEIRYTGTAQDQTSGSTEDSNSDSSNFNPFKASDGVLRADFYLGYHLSSPRRYREDILPTLNSTFVGGFGLSTLKGVADNGRDDLTNSKRRLFIGYRLTVPRYKTDFETGDSTVKVESLKEIAAPRGYIQFSYARDEIWKFPVTDPASLETRTIDERNRFVIDGIFQFFEISTSDTMSIPITARIRWDTPLNLNGGSDLRISILAAANFFKL